MPNIISFESTWTFEPVTFQTIVDQLKAIKELED